MVKSITTKKALPKKVLSKNEVSTELNPFKFNSTIDKSLFSIEKLRRHKILFNRFKFGLLEFFFEVTYQKSNVFLCFFCKAENYPTKVFVFFKQSLGLENRDKIRKGLSPKVLMRGRRKTQAPFIRNKFNIVKNYLFEFIKHHPEITAYKLICIIWKLHKFDVTIHNLMNQTLKITYSFNVIERVLKEYMKNEILARLGLRTKLDLNPHDIISKFFVKKAASSDVFLFRKNKKMQISEFKEELGEKFKLLQSEDTKNKLIEIIKLQLRNSKNSKNSRNPIETNAFDFIKKNVNIISKSLSNSEFNFEKNKYHPMGDIAKKDYQDDNYIDKYVNNVDLVSDNKYLSISDTKALTLGDRQLSRYEEYLDKSLKLNKYIISSYQPAIMHKVIVKFPHNGCRGKKARRLKRSNK
nr:hypothetical protein [Actinophrys sol]